MGKEGRERDEEEEITWEEINEAMDTMKDKKAADMNEMPNEVWKYGGKEMRECVWVMCNRVWKGEGWPELWKQGVVVPIVKRGKGEVVKDYRVVTLMPTLYKIYVAVLLERLKKDVEEKKTIKKKIIKKRQYRRIRQGLGKEWE